MEKEKLYSQVKNDDFLDLQKNKKRLKFVKTLSKKVEKQIRMSENKKLLLILLGILVEIEDGFSIDLILLENEIMNNYTYGCLATYIMLIEKIKEINKIAGC